MALRNVATEAEVLAIVDLLPHDSFIYQYVHWAMQNCEAHALYHVGCAIALAAQAPPNDYSLQFMNPAYPNIYVLLYGNSAIGGKGRAVYLATKVAKAADIPLGFKPASKEALIDQLIDQPKILITYEEFGALLASNSAAKTDASLKTALADLYDCTAQSNDTMAERRAKREMEAKQSRRKMKEGDPVFKPRAVVVAEPRLSIIGGISPEFLEAYMDVADWTGGFVRRFFMLVANPERTIDVPRMNDDGHLRLAKVWKERLWSIGNGAPGRCDGFTEAADAMFGEWNRKNRKLTKSVPGEVRGAVAAGVGHVLRLCGILGWDNGVSRQGAAWRIDTNLLLPALKLCDLAIASAMQIGESLALSPDMRARRNVLAATKDSDTTIGELCFGAHILRKKLMEVTETLIAEGTITTVGPGCFKKTGRTTPQSVGDLEPALGTQEPALGVEPEKSNVIPFPTKPAATSVGPTVPAVPAEPSVSMTSDVVADVFGYEMPDDV
jgi:hypothetical protein